MTNIFILICDLIIRSEKAIPTRWDPIPAVKTAGAGSDRPTSRQQPGPAGGGLTAFRFRVAILRSRQQLSLRRLCAAAGLFRGGRPCINSIAAAQPRQWKGRHHHPLRWRRHGAGIPIDEQLLVWPGLEQPCEGDGGRRRLQGCPGRVSRWLDGQWLPTDRRFQALLGWRPPGTLHSKPRRQHLCMLHEGRFPRSFVARKLSGKDGT
jgi:hypothetical protein